MKTLVQILLLFLLIFFRTPNSVFAQQEIKSHYDINVGLSTSDALNFGLRYGFGQNNIAVNIGGDWPARSFFQIVGSFSYYRHLWGESRHTGVRPWYAKAAIHYNYSESELTRGNFSIMRRAGARLHLGRDFNLLPRLGFSTSVGPMLILYERFYDDQKLRKRAVASMDLMIYYRL